MVIRYTHVTKEPSDVDGRIFRAEYTIDCGWVDWSHAGPDRADIKTIWADLPPNNKKKKPDVQLRNMLTGEEYGYWVVKVPQLDGTDIKDGATRHYWVRHFQDIKFYKRAALTLYEISCAAVETSQDNKLLDVVGKSGWSTEDLLSNLLAFYGHVEGLNSVA